VRLELGEREVEVDRPGGVDDLGDRVSHAADEGFLETQVGLIKRAIQRYDLDGLCRSDVEPSDQQTADDSLKWRGTASGTEDD